MSDERIETVLEPYEPHEVVIVPVYSGELGARGVIDHWEAIVRLYRGKVLVGHADTIDAAIRTAISDE